MTRAEQMVKPFSGNRARKASEAGRLTPEARWAMAWSITPWLGPATR